MRFQVVAGNPNFRMESLDELARRPDRDRFNLPGALTGLTPLEVRTAWLPAYVVECVSGLLVHIKALDAADPYLGKVITPYLQPVLELEPREDDREVWREWLAGKGFRDAPLRRLPNRVWRASLPGEAFTGGRLQWWQLGSFETRKHSFLQVWCEDEEIRRRALLERAANFAGGISDEVLAGVAELLGVAVPDLDGV